MARRGTSPHNFTISPVTRVAGETFATGLQDRRTVHDVAIFARAHNSSTRAKINRGGTCLPLAWQGWVFFFSWILIVPLGVRFLAPGSKPMRWAFIAAMVILLLVICYWKGEPTGRRWNSGDGN